MWSDNHDDWIMYDKNKFIAHAHVHVCLLTSWWRHNMDTLIEASALCEWNSSIAMLYLLSRPQWQYLLNFPSRDVDINDGNII